METEDLTSHISNRFNADLKRLNNQFLMMGGQVEQQLKDAVAAIVDMNLDRADSVISNEKLINEQEIFLDNECIEVLALRQPAAGDLRMVVAIFRSIADLERIGDESKKIAKLALQIADQNVGARGCIETRHISGQVVTMMRNALDAFARFDVDMALSVLQDDKKVDVEYKATMRQLVTYMMEDPRSISRALNVIWALRAMERIGDHAHNIAENLIYLVKGKDVRHAPLDSVKDTLAQLQQESEESGEK